MLNCVIIRNITHFLFQRGFKPTVDFKEHGLTKADCVKYALYYSEWDNALRLYANLVFQRQNIASPEATMNLAALYTALNKKSDAINLYGSLGSRHVSNELRSDIQYNIGKIQYDKNEKRNALLSLSYSIELNPNNHKARLLIKQLQ